MKIIVKAQIGTTLFPDQQIMEQQALKDKDDIEYRFSHDWKSKDEDRARRFAAGLSSVGAGVQYAGPVGAALGAAMQIPDFLYDFSDVFRSYALHGGKSGDFGTSVGHLLLDVPLVRFAQELKWNKPLFKRFQNWLQKHNMDEYASSIGAIDDAAQSAGYDLIEMATSGGNRMGNPAQAHAEVPNSTYVKKPLIAQQIKRKKSSGRLLSRNPVERFKQRYRKNWRN